MAGFEAFLKDGEHPLAPKAVKKKRKKSNESFKLSDQLWDELKARARDNDATSPQFARDVRRLELVERLQTCTDSIHAGIIREELDMILDPERHGEWEAFRDRRKW